MFALLGEVPERGPASGLIQNGRPSSPASRLDGEAEAGKEPAQVCRWPARGEKGDIGPFPSGLRWQGCGKR